MMRALPFLVALILSFLLPGCLTPEEAVKEVDLEAMEALGRKEEEFRGARSAFRVDPPADRLMATAIDPETGQVRPGVELMLSLDDALRIAAVNSRDFQDQKESLYRATLAFLRSRATFRGQPSGLFGAGARSSNDVRSIDGDSSFGLTRLLKSGGSYALNVGLDALRVVSAPTGNSLSSFMNLTIALPFLRNAGQEIVTENLIQSDRDLLYALRDFERFKQTYGVRVISTYLRLLSSKRQIFNEEANLKSLKVARERNESLAEEGRIAIVEVDQARQQELSGENRLAFAVQSYEGAVDSFKDLIGLPVGLKLVVNENDLERLEALVDESFTLAPERAISLALKARLDLRNAVDGVADAIRRIAVAENQLLPDLSVILSASATSNALKPLRYDFSEGTYAATVDLDLPLDRELESISLRTALLDLQRVLRAQEQTAERIKLDVKDSLRQLYRTRETLRITKKAVELAEQRVRSTSALLQLGRTTTRDFLESQDDLVRNQNDLVNALVEYRISFLDLFSDTGVLVVSAEGLDHETSTDLLLAP